ncbi:MAG: diaminopimelate epimerase [Bacteroidota bacterium]
MHSFTKYQGTGNDFIMIDNRKGVFPKDQGDYIANLCHRRYGVGADGLILLEEDEVHDFKMVYFNSDGRESTMCGNGGRCLVAFAKQMGVITSSTKFSAIDGIHHATIQGDRVTLGMVNVATIQQGVGYVFLDTGSPHHVEMVSNLEDYDVFEGGRQLRYDRYGVEGSNINFVEQLDTDSFKVRTYERGVEEETLSCGTGVTAVALAMYHTHKTKATNITILTQGGELQVQFAVHEGRYQNITLTGPATKVFQGTL